MIIGLLFFIIGCILLMYSLENNNPLSILFKIIAIIFFVLGVCFLSSGDIDLTDLFV